MPISVIYKFLSSSIVQHNEKHAHRKNEKEHALTTGLKKLVQSDVHPPATIPNESPKTRRPASAWPITPQNMNVASDAVVSVMAASSHGAK